MSGSGTSTENKRFIEYGEVTILDLRMPISGLDDFIVDALTPFTYSSSNGGTASGLVYLTFTRRLRARGRADFSLIFAPTDQIA